MLRSKYNLWLKQVTVIQVAEFRAEFSEALFSFRLQRDASRVFHGYSYKFVGP